VCTKHLARKRKFAEFEVWSMYMEMESYFGLCQSLSTWVPEWMPGSVILQPIVLITSTEETCEDSLFAALL